jgi:segregation and condensation protein B
MISTDTMTLGRFVRVTLSNFRQLIRNINAPITSPMTNPTIRPPQKSDSLSPVAPPAPRRARTPVAAAPVEAAAAADVTGAAAEMPGVNSAGVVADTAAANEAEALLLDQVAATGLALPAVLESLLFVADGAVEPAQLARACGLALPAVEQGLADLAAHYRTDGRGLRLQERVGRYQLVTAPETGAIVEAFLQVDMTARLSGPALETLAVIAYRQPVTRAQVEAVRGVDCSGVLRSLLQRGLLEEVGRLDAPGRPVLYGVTDLFMHHFGLTGLHELPPLENAEAIRLDDVLSERAALLVATTAAASGASDRGN